MNSNGQWAAMKMQLHHQNLEKDTRQQHYQWERGRTNQMSGLCNGSISSWLSRMHCPGRRGTRGGSDRSGRSAVEAPSHDPCTPDAQAETTPACYLVIRIAAGGYRSQHGAAWGVAMAAATVTRTVTMSDTELHTPVSTLSCLSLPLVSRTHRHMI